MSNRLQAVLSEGIGWNGLVPHPFNSNQTCKPLTATPTPFPTLRRFRNSIRNLPSRSTLPLFPLRPCGGPRLAAARYHAGAPLSRKEAGMHWEERPGFLRQLPTAATIEATTPLQTFDEADKHDPQLYLDGRKLT